MRLSHIELIMVAVVAYFGGMIGTAMAIAYAVARCR
jgi:hypothetical protein